MNKCNPLLCVLFFGALLASCTKDPAYNEENLRNIDVSGTLFEEGMGIPCDTSIMVRLEEKIELSDVLTCDPDGNYVIRKHGTMDGSTINIPKISFSGNSLFSGTSSFATGALSGMTVKDVAVSVGEFNHVSELAIQGEVPAEILDIRSAEVSADIRLVIRANSDLCCLGKDFRLIFPKGLSFEKGEEAEWYSIENDPEGRCIIRFAESVTAGNDLIFNIRLCRIEMQSGWLTDGTVNIHAPVQLIGDIYAKGSGTIPESFELHYEASMSDVTVKKSDCRLNFTSEISGKSIDVDIPETFRENSKIIFDNPEVTLTILNTPRLVMNASLQIAASTGGVDFGKKLTVNIPGCSDAEYSFVINEQSCPGLSEMLSSLPDRIVISCLDIRSDTSVWIGFDASENQRIGADYSLNIPLALKHGSYITLTQDEEVDISLGDIRTSDLEFDMSFDNRLPATVSYSFKMTIDGKTFDVMTDKLPSVASGEVQDFKATIHSDTPFNYIEDLSVEAVISVTEAGAVLNRNQSVLLRIKSLNLPKGITIE